MDPFENDDHPILHPKLTIYQVRLCYLIDSLCDEEGRFEIELRTLYKHSRRKSYEQIERDLHRLHELGVYEFFPAETDEPEWLDNTLRGRKVERYADAYYEEWRRWEAAARKRIEKEEAERRAHNEKVLANVDRLLEIELRNDWDARNGVKTPLTGGSGPLQTRDGFPVPIEEPSYEELLEMYDEHDLDEFRIAVKYKLDILLEPEEERYA